MIEANTQYHFDGHTVTFQKAPETGDILRAADVAEIDGKQPRPHDKVPDWFGAFAASVK